MKYLRIIIELLKVNFSKTLIYRGHFYVETANSLCWGGLAVITIIILTSKVSTVFGWTRNELILLAAMVNVIYGILRVLFDINFWAFSETINTGKLDTVLLKPIDSQFQMSIWGIDFGGIMRIIAAIGLTIYLIFVFHFTVNPMSIIAGIFFSILGVTMLYSISFIFLTITIWFSNLYNLMHLINTIIGASRYPKEMYVGLITPLFFFLLPIVLIIGTPTKALINHLSFQDALLLTCFTIIFFSISRIFWKFALRFYTSASG